MLIMIIAAGGIFLFAHSRAASRENRTSYAELPAAATQDTPIAATSSPDTTRVPILVYHIVRPSYPNDSKEVRALAQTPETFDAQMKHLADADYRVISFRDLERHFSNGTPLPAKSVILSFDDGWSDQFAYAFPVLKKYGYSATFFVFTNAIGRRGFLTWEELRAMLGAGMTVGSHSRSHPFLTKMAEPSALWNEIYESRKMLEKNLGVSIDEFAYPFGQYNPEIVSLVKKAGYASARGDYYYGAMQSADRLYELSALNAPTTTELFARRFPKN